MWPIPEIQARLPEFLRVEEDAEVVRLRCARCRWEAPDTSPPTRAPR